MSKCEICSVSHGRPKRTSRGVHVRCSVNLVGPSACSYPREDLASIFVAPDAPVALERV